MPRPSRTKLSVEESLRRFPNLDPGIFKEDVARQRRAKARYQKAQLAWKRKQRGK